MHIVVYLFISLFICMVTVITNVSMRYFKDLMVWNYMLYMFYFVRNWP